MKTLTASDRSALIRLASSLPVGSPERKAVLTILNPKTASQVKNGEGDMSRPIKIRGISFNAYSYEVDKRSIYITLYADNGDSAWAVIDEDLSDKDWHIAAVDAVRKSLDAGRLPRGFYEDEFQLT
jgi:hypothetical protein